MLVSSGALGWGWSVLDLPKAHSHHPTSTDLLLQAGLPVSHNICLGNKVHLRLCLPYLGAVSCLLCCPDLDLAVLKGT